MLASNSMPEQPPGPRRLRLSRLVVPLLLVLCFAKICLLLLAAVHSRYVPDEYIQADYSRYATEGGFYDEMQPIKTVLYAYYFRLARELADSSVELMLIARLQGFVLAVGMVLLVYGISRRLGADRAGALLAVLVLLAFSNFMERSFRVRADTLAAFLALAGLWVAVGGRAADALRQRWRPIVVGLLVGTAFLSTQKAVYHAVAFGLGYLAVGLWWGPAESASSRLRRGLAGFVPAALFSLGWAASVLAYSVYFGGAGFLRILTRVFLAPRQLALHGGEVYRELWVPVYQTIQRNQLAYGLTFVGLVLGCTLWRRLAAKQALSLIVALVLTALVFSHNQPWPYVFVLLLPFLAPWSLQVVDWLVPVASEGDLGDESIPADLERRAAVLLILAGILSLSFPRNVYALRTDNAEQDRVVATAESMLAPGDSYADGIGMIPTRPRAGARWWWDAATMMEIRKAALEGDFPMVEETLEDRPKLWVVSYRVQDLWSILGPFLTRSYLPVAANILLTGTRLDTGTVTEFVAVWPGRYRLYDLQGDPVNLPFLIDGRPARGEVELATGPYRLELGAAGEAAPSELGDGAPPGSVLLLPAGLELTGPLPASGPAEHLFAKVYD